MLAKRIIACLDVKAGRVVKGVKFLELRDAGDPVECALRYDREGVDEVTFLDITATHEERAILIDVVARTASELRAPLTVGGGVRERRDVDALLRAGADKVSMNSAAIANPELIAETSAAYGCQAIVVAIDAKRVAQSTHIPSGYEVFTHGGRNGTGRDALVWAKEAEQRGAGEILLTSMDRDGTQVGYDLDLTRAIATSVRIPVIASGGVGSPEHIFAGLTQGAADAALAASIFHDGIYSVRAVKQYLAERGVCVRPV